MFKVCSNLLTLVWLWPRWINWHRLHSLRIIRFVILFWHPKKSVLHSRPHQLAARPFLLYDTGAAACTIYYNIFITVCKFQQFTSDLSVDNFYGAHCCKCEAPTLVQSENEHIFPSIWVYVRGKCGFEDFLVFSSEIHFVFPQKQQRGFISLQVHRLVLTS